MALAIRLEDLLENGLVGSQSDIAKTAGITTARDSQIVNLNCLAPDIQQPSSNSNPQPSEVIRFSNDTFARSPPTSIGGGNERSSRNWFERIRKLRISWAKTRLARAPLRT